MIVIGGEWGSHARMVTAIDEHFSQTPRSVPVTAAALPSPELAGARTRAVEELRSLIIQSVRPSTDP
ncbi:hypothetical protein ACFY12_08830 [Streptomyces sp. NPDC001339]|uniref:hypothetical protein n=1 Tax=Streptomyces sp. NPDC001339 TaxID=3364563 RepID=UPI003693D428